MSHLRTPIEWQDPWRAVHAETELPHVQRQLERELSYRHPLHGKGARVVGRRIDIDDVVAVLSDGSYVKVHLVWARSMGSATGSSESPSWLACGSHDRFIELMRADAAVYRGEA